MQLLMEITVIKGNLSALEFPTFFCCCKNSFSRKFVATMKIKKSLQVSKWGTSSIFSDTFK